MKAKAIAAQFIAEFGKEDPDYITLMETIVDLEGKDLSEKKLDAKTDKVLGLIKKAKVSVSWEDDDSEYVF